MTIAPGSIVCTPGSVTAHVGQQEAVRHLGNTVVVYVARLVPPWFNVTVPINGDGESVVASMWILGRRRLKEALRGAGFEVIEHITWTYRGFRW